MLTIKRIEIKYGFITLALLLGLFALGKTQALGGLDGYIDSFFDLMTKLGVIGFFIIGLVCNSTLIVQIPYTVPLLSLSLSGAGIETIILMGIASGIGAGMGEVISYGMALKLLGLNPDLEKSRLFQWVKRMVNSHPRLIPFVVFAGAISPLPDDTIIIPLAIVGYKLKKIALPLFSGKVLNNLLVAAVFYIFTDWSAERVSATVQADLALGILILFVMVILYQVEKTRAIAPSLMKVSPTVE